MKDHATSAQPAAVVTPSDAAAMPRPPDNLATPILDRHDLEVEYYAPVDVDRQSPHDRDELYVVARGNGCFRVGDRRHVFGPGDLLFVRAGEAHSFEDFTADFAVWVVFFGPKS